VSASTAAHEGSDPSRVSRLAANLARSVRARACTHKSTASAQQPFQRCGFRECDCVHSILLDCDVAGRSSRRMP
jgi:hypothetical protein